MVSVTKTTAAFFAFLLFLAGTAGAAQQPYNLDVGEDLEVGEMNLAIGKSRIVTTPTNLSQVMIGNPNVADVRLLSSRRVLLLGKKPGRTNLAFRDENDDVIALLDIVVRFDIEGIKRKIHELLPQEKGIEVRSANAAVLLSGQVSDSLAMDTALTAARSFAGNDNVKNMLQVAGGQQVMLEVHIAEVKRNSFKGLGVKNTISGSSDADNFTFDIITGAAGAGLTDSFVQGVTGKFGQSRNFFWPDLEMQLQALENKGAAKTLAEPNIVALSGQQASFLAGGEFPVPVVQSGASDSITVEFKEFGVGLEFTPTVLSSKKINLRLQTEVSSIDNENATTVLGTSVPAVSTRRAGTTVELADGQSFAIAGLLQNDIDNAVSQFPGLGDIPVLGALFRSTEFRRNETELAIVVKPRLVKPGPAGSIKLPTDNFIPPSDIDQYLMGRLEGVPEDPEEPEEGEADAEEGMRETESADTEGGLEGSYGHQL
ncbi:MAG TPA: type II and III secretion system protein family protein [Gammaproteobacteria bacterium]|nr:type II and III secretion system protein family protein [Gammaproteobacteria bacterium]